MKSYSLVATLFVLIIVSVSFADPMPVPEDAEETGEIVDAVETGAAVEVEVMVEPKPLTHYSPLIAGFGNIIPGLGYFLIDEPWWAVAEYALMGGEIAAGAIVAWSRVTNDLGHASEAGMIVAGGLLVITYTASIIHAPLLASYKYHQQKVALDLTPGLGLDSEGGAYPTVQLTLSF